MRIIFRHNTSHSDMVDNGNKNFLADFDIASYQMFHKDRRGRRGGEVAIQAQQNVPPAIKFKQMSTENLFVWTSIQGNKN